MVSLDANKVREQLEKLRDLPNLREVVALRKRLTKELEFLTKKVKPQPVKPIPKFTRAEKISKSLKKQFNYLRQIRNNFPELSWLELRREYSKRRQGLETDVPDAVWQNPSP